MADPTTVRPATTAGAAMPPVTARMAPPTAAAPPMNPYLIILSLLHALLLEASASPAVLLAPILMISLHSATSAALIHCHGTLSSRAILLTSPRARASYFLATTDTASVSQQMVHGMPEM